MGIHVLDSITREKTGKEAAKKIRRKGYIPAILYGHGVKKCISIKYLEFDLLFNEVGGHSIISLNIDGKESFDAIIKDFQIDAVKKNIIHADFYEVEKGKLLKTEIPIKTVGTAKGVKAGGILEVFNKDLEIECLPKDIPEFIKLDIAELEIGDSLHVKEVKVAGGIKIISNQEQVILTIGTPTVMAAPTKEEEVEEVVAAEKETVEEEKTE